MATFLLDFIGEYQETFFFFFPSPGSEVTRSFLNTTVLSYQERRIISTYGRLDPAPELIDEYAMAGLQKLNTACQVLKMIFSLLY